MESCRDESSDGPLAGEAPDARAEGPTPADCEPLTGAKQLSLDQGESFGFIGEAVQTFNAEAGGRRYNNVTFSSLVGPTLEVVVPHVDLIVRSPDPSKPVSICQ